MESAIYVVATPIGNLSDITIRAIEVLKGVDMIAAEDTRHSKRLLQHYGIEARLLSLHDHNEKEKASWVIDQIEEGKSIALISDAGTPLISDPGYTLVSKAKERGVDVVPIPGPSALIAALCASGLASDRFSFEGFLPVKNKAKQDRFESIKEDTRTFIFYESPRRVIDTLQLMREVLGDRKVCIARELTKRYETIKTALISELELFVQSEEQQKGEFVLIVSGYAGEQLSEDESLKRRLLALLLKELPPKKASAVVAEFYGGTKKEVYEMALSLKS